MPEIKFIMNGYKLSFQTGRGANRDQPTGEQLIEFAVSVNKKVTTRLHNEWMKGII